MVCLFRIFFHWYIFHIHTYIHSLHQLQDVQYDKSKPNIGFDGNAWGFEYRDYKIKKKQNKQTTPHQKKPPKQTWYAIK